MSSMLAVYSRTPYRSGKAPYFYKLVRKEGFEPSILSALVSKTSVYPVPPLALKLVWVGRFELPTSRFQGEPSDQADNTPR